MTTEIVIRLARIGTIPETKDLHSNTRQRDRSRMHALTELITVHGREHQPVVFYSEKLGLSVPHLNRIARREAGASVQELAALHLVRAAKRDLLFTPASVSAIAYSLGFQDPAYFNRFFKRQTGITPGQFRIQERHQASVKETKTGKSTNSYSLPD